MISPLDSTTGHPTLSAYLPSGGHLIVDLLGYFSRPPPPGPVGWRRSPRSECSTPASRRRPPRPRAGRLDPTPTRSG
ncbi:MAG: hypothetical protein R2705_11280 [Ilumatobacteraceae bacterium]